VGGVGRVGVVPASVRRAAARGLGVADCAVGSGQWAEPPQYLPALSWAGTGVARGGSSAEGRRSFERTIPHRPTARQLREAAQGTT